MINRMNGRQDLGTIFTSSPKAVQSVPDRLETGKWPAEKHNRQKDPIKAVENSGK
jgi:hypothetical protein